MKVKAQAKLNLSLDIVGKTDNGYHLLDMIMVPISLCDEMEIEIIEGEENQGVIEITCDDKTVPCDEKNTVYKVVDKFLKAYQIKCGFRVHICKKIPSEAGLGGGSSDAVAVLKAIVKMLGMDVSKSEMIEIVKDIGSDMSFFVYNQFAVVKGIGEKIEPFDAEFDGEFLLVKPSSGVSTEQAYRQVDLHNVKHFKSDKLKKMLKLNDFEKSVQLMGNSLEKIAQEINEEIGTVISSLKALGFEKVMMTGSGSCVFGITKDNEILQTGYNEMKKKYEFVHLSSIKVEK